MSGRYKLMLVAAVIGLASNALAQSGSGGGGERPERRGHVRPNGDGPERPRGEPGEDAGELLLGRLPGPNPFRPRREDFSKEITAQEETALLEFARKHQPRLYQALAKVRSGSQERYKVRFTEVAPRLRLLRRFFDDRPGIAADYSRHIENFDEIFRLFRDWNRAQGIRRQNFENTIQRLLAENLTIELRLIEDRVSDLKDNLDKYSKEEAEQLTAENAPLPPGPPKIVQLIRDVRSAADDAERRTALDVLEIEIFLMLEDQIDFLKDRSQILSDDKAAAIQSRFETLKKRAAMMQQRENGRGRGGEPPPRDGPGRIRRPPRP